MIDVVHNTGVRMENRVKLNVGESLRRLSHRSKGSLAETDIEEYEIVDAAGTVVGTVTYTDHTTINGLKRQQSLVQRDASSNVIHEERW